MSCCLDEIEQSNIKNFINKNISINDNKELAIDVINKLLEN